MDRMQIALKLGMDVLGIQISIKNYQQICDAAYQAEQTGAYISPTWIRFNKNTGHAYSTPTHESGGSPSRNLVDDVFEIEQELKEAQKLGFPDDSKGHQLDRISIKKLENLRKNT